MFKVFRIGVLAMAFGASVILVASAPVLADTNPVHGALEVFYKAGDQYISCNRNFLYGTYCVANTGWCTEDHRINGKKYDHSHTTVGFPFMHGNQLVTQEMANQGWDNHLGPAWVRLTDATCQYNCHGYTMGVTSPLILSGTNGSLLCRDEGFENKTPPVDLGFIMASDGSHSSKFSRLEYWYDAWLLMGVHLWLCGVQTQKDNSSGVYMTEFLPAARPWIASNWQPK